MFSRGEVLAKLPPFFIPVRATDSPKANKNVDTDSLGHKKTLLGRKG